MCIKTDGVETVVRVILTNRHFSTPLFQFKSLLSKVEPVPFSFCRRSEIIRGYDKLSEKYKISHLIVTNTVNIKKYIFEYFC